MGTPPQAPPPAPVQPQPQGTPGIAVAAFVCGLIGLFSSWLVFGVILSVLGIIFGVIGKRQADERGGQGSGLALAGLIMGVIGVVILIALIIIGATIVNETEDALDDITFTTTTSFVVGAWLLRDRVMPRLTRRTS